MITLKYFRSTTAAYSSQIIQTSTNTLERHAKKFLWTSRTHYVLKRGFQFLPDRSATHPVYWPSFFRQTIHVQRTASITCKLSALAVKREETVSVRRRRENEREKTEQQLCSTVPPWFLSRLQRKQENRGRTHTHTHIALPHIKHWSRSNTFTHTDKHALFYRTTFTGVSLYMWSLSCKVNYNTKHDKTYILDAQF